MQPSRLLTVISSALTVSVAWGQPQPNPGASLQAAQNPRETAVLGLRGSRC